MHSDNRDQLDRTRITKQILGLLPPQPIYSKVSGSRLNVTGRRCLYLNEVVDVLTAVYRAGKAKGLDSHFLPQQYHCFADHPVTSWKYVVDAKKLSNDAKLIEAVGQRLGTAEPFPRMHTTHGLHTHQFRSIFPASIAQLDSLVEDELMILSAYISR